MLPLRGRVVRWLAGSSDEDQRVRWHADGRDFEFDVPGDNLWIAVKDDLLLREYEWMGAPPETERTTVVDAGAHVGTFAAMAAGHARRVIGVEPNPANIELLTENLARNGIDNVEVLEAAIWPEPGEISLAVDGPTSSSSIVVGGGTTVTVPTISLSDLIDRVGAVDLLKMDIEGAEFEVLCRTPPETLRQIDVIVGELHLWATDDSTAQRLYAWLEAAGFTVEVRKGPIYYPAQSLRTLRRNWSSVEGQFRLKTTIAGTYALAAIIGRIPRLRDRLATEELRLFVATRDQ